MDDFEADEACLKVGVLPYDVFPGYLEAGLDPVGEDGNRVYP
jgi:hypothetical protein